MVPIEQKDWTEEGKTSIPGQNHPLDSTKKPYFIGECMFMPTASAERLLPVDEIRRRLRSLRFDRRPRLTDVAKAAGLHRAQLYNLIEIASKFSRIGTNAFRTHY
jgi:hypothetical protein